jgi:hypothetical protein
MVSSSDLLLQPCLAYRVCFLVYNTTLPIPYYSSFPVNIISCPFKNTYSYVPISLSWQHQSNPSCSYAARQYLDISYPCEQLQNNSSSGAMMSALYLARAIANRLKLSARHLSRSKDMVTSTTSGHETSILVVCVSRCFIALFRNYTELRQVFFLRWRMNHFRIP